MRWNVSAAVVCLVLVLSGCANPLDRPSSSAKVPTGCGECTAEVADLVAELTSSDAVLDVRGTRRTTTGSGFLGIGVDLDGDDVVSADLDALFDGVAETAWRSGVTPLDTLSVSGVLRNGYAETVAYDFGADRAAFEKRWGARPKGSDWTPVPDEADESDGLVGCEVDGCHDLFRGVARDASALPGVTAVLSSAYARDTPTNASSADVDVESDGTVAVDDLAEQVAEIVWRSTISPIDAISVTVETPDGGFPDDVTFQIDPDHGRDHERLQEMWGPRPVG
ncbi:hypothetical protein [Nocardioides zeicaulis]|uniref:LppX_LprAFG lipoprotein n=1 Tax=Nocardioides zeicaulis TaxID=1776857 RepID=A0ABV6E404_9ACTN